MEVFDTPDGLRAWSRAHRAAGRRVGLVPTMGALHDGHLALVDRAREDADVVALSIFVNPLQFNRSDDFTSYPRPLDDDLALCRARRVDAVYAPLAATMYPDGFQTRVVPGALAEVLEGAQRPGHFEGVTTVVAKLFLQTGADYAMFGEKDYQQLMVIRRMAEDLAMPVQIIGVETMRESNGLAMSSRNGYLSEDERAIAPVLYRVLSGVAQTLREGSQDFAGLQAQAARELDANGLRTDYVAIRRAVDLLEPAAGEDELAILAAAFLGKARLIDNIEVKR